MAMRNARLATIANALDGAAAPGLLRLYTGPRPAISEAIGDQLLLAEVRLPRPCTAHLNGGVLIFAPIPRALCRHTGTAAWAPVGMCIAPNAQHQGTGLPFAGSVYAASVAPTALRTADVKVPDPRGRKR